MVRAINLKISGRIHKALSSRDVSYQLMEKDSILLEAILRIYLATIFEGKRAGQFFAQILFRWLKPLYDFSFTSLHDISLRLFTVDDFLFCKSSAGFFLLVFVQSLPSKIKGVVPQENFVHLAPEGRVKVLTLLEEKNVYIVKQAKKLLIATDTNMRK